MSVSKKSQIGETYICIKDVVMQGTGVVEFIKGKKYYCEYPSTLTNENGYMYHYFTTELEEYFKQFFTIKDLADGKCAVDNTGNPDVEKLKKVLKLAFPADATSYEGFYKFYSSAKDNKYSRWTDNNQSLPTQLLADFELPEEKLEMVEGEYYRIDDVIGGNPFWMILKCEGHVRINDERGDCNGKLISHSELNGYIYKKDGCCFWDNGGRNFRKATQDEINWLDACIAADKFISYEDYPRQYMQVDTQEEEKKAHNDEKFYLPKIEIIQKWMLVWDRDSNESKAKKAFVLTKFENSKIPYTIIPEQSIEKYFAGQEFVKIGIKYAKELPNHDGTEREIDGQTYLLTLKK